MAVFGFGLYSVLSAALAYLVVAHAYATREQFYPTVIYLVTSKFSIVVLCNMAFVMIVALAKFLKTVFLGELRQNEVEVGGSWRSVSQVGELLVFVRVSVVPPRTARRY